MIHIIVITMKVLVTSVIVTFVGGVAVVGKIKAAGAVRLAEEGTGQSTGLRRLGTNTANNTTTQDETSKSAAWFCFWCPAEKQAIFEEAIADEVGLSLSNLTFIDSSAPTMATTSSPSTANPSINPTELPTSSPSVVGSTIPSPTPQPTELLPRLKMYWEEGYYWQDEDFDRVWCAAYHYDYEGYACYYGQDEKRCNDYHIYIDYCREQDNEHFQRFEIIHLQNNNVMIRMADGDWCWAYSGDYVEWQHCNSQNRRQQWIANVDAYRFQIRSATRSSLCVTQHHHPKPGEVLELVNCNRARETKTSYWNLYW